MNQNQLPDPLAKQRDLLQPLLDDHRVVRDVLASMERRVIDERLGRSPANGFWDLVLSFFEDHAGSVHHSFEDERLLTELAQGGFAAPGSAARIARQEHERMGPFLQHLRHAVLHAEAFELRATAQAFVALHRQHMDREESSVFPLLRAALARSGGEELKRELGFLEADALGERARAEHLAEEVRRLSFADCAG